MSIPIIDQLRPLGNFPAVDASDVQAGNQRLSTVLSNTPTTTYVDAVVENKVDKEEGKGLSTNDFTNAYKSKLDGLDAALAAKANSSDVTSGLAGKVDKETGKGLSTNDYTTAEKNKLAGIEAQANKTVVDDALSSSSTNPVQNKAVKAALDEQNSSLNVVNNTAITAGATSLKCASIAEYYSSGRINGSCYVGNGIIVYYVAYTDRNTGELVAFNINTYAELWRYNMTLYHGNSITYNEENNCIYVTGCFDVSDTSVLIKKVFEIDLSSPNTIKRTITLDRTVYGLSYNNSNGKFYVTAYRGATAGEADRIYVYDDEFNYESYFDLEDFPTVKYGVSNQGVSLTINDKLYIIIYDREAQIIEYEIPSGRMLKVYNVPSIVNDYRLVTEIESLYFDYDRNIIGFAFYGTDQLHNWTLTFADTNITRDIFVNRWIPSGSARGELYINILNTTPTNYKPAHIDHTLRSVSDGMSLQSHYNGRINFNVTGDDIARQVKIVNVKDIEIDFNGISLTGGLLITSGNCIIHHCSISGTITTADNVKAAVVAQDSADVVLYQVTLTAPENGYCGYAYRGGRLKVQEMTYTGTLGISNFKGEFETTPSDSDDIRCGNTAIPSARLKIFEGTIQSNREYSFSIPNIGWSAFNVMIIAITLKGSARMFICSMPGNTGVCNCSAIFIDNGIMYIRYADITLDKLNNKFTTGTINQLKTSDGTISTGIGIECKIYLARI